MLGIVVFCLFMAMGVVQAKCLFCDRGSAYKFWLGSVMGLMEMMWLPSLFAYRFDFTMHAQLYALACALLVTFVFALLSGRRSGKAVIGKKEIDAGFLMLLVIPASVVGAYLQYTHSFPVIDGAMHVGQSTYGDLSMHAGFATGLIGQSYPPEYTILPGTKLGYPFLVDALSSTMILFGTSLTNSIFVPGAVMTFLVYMGFAIFAWELTKKKTAAAIAFLLFFFSGGLGFFRTMVSGARIDGNALYDALFGYYMTPTNMPDENLRWVNALCDLIVPQRTLMAGWMCLFPAFYLMISGMRRAKIKEFIILAVWAGAMPMIHTHSFLALGAISFGALVYCLMCSKRRKKALLLFGIYGIGACAVAIWQLLEWTFPQTIDGGSLKLYFNWVNNNGIMANGESGFVSFIREAFDLVAYPSRGLKENYFIFWTVNTGLMYIVFPFAAFFAEKKIMKALASGALILYVISECVLFQPNEYDNIKLFYAAYLVMLPIGADYLVRKLERLKGNKNEGALALVRKTAASFLLIAFMFVSCVSGFVSIVRESVSDYEIISKAQCEAAEYIKENTDKDSVFLTATNHNNAVSVLTGRKIVCGPGMYLYFHGLDYSKREESVNLMLSAPLENRQLFDMYDVDYIYISSYERSMGADDADFEKLFVLVYSHDEGYESIRIYKADAKDGSGIN